MAKLTINKINLQIHYVFYTFVLMCLHNFSSECSFVISLMRLIVYVYTCLGFGLILIGMIREIFGLGNMTLVVD
jgi:hypothetical protein